VRDACLERADGAAHLTGMTRHIDDGVERLTVKRREAIRVVTVHADEASAVWNGAGHATRRACHVMARRAGVRGDCAPEKLRAAENQQAHSASPTSACPTDALKVRSGVQQFLRQHHMDALVAVDHLRDPQVGGEAAM
jgi:hypothetical protein